MTNTNCLENIQCPACGNEESFRIAATTIVTVTDDGTEDHGDMEWDDDSYAECAKCHRHGTLKDFEVTTQPLSECEADSPSAADPAKKPYSVLLLYPDYVTDGGTETYYAFVEAPDPNAAVAQATRQAVAAQEGVAYEPDDFAPLLVTEGHHASQPLFNV
jgi:hypothetical protein